MKAQVSSVASCSDEEYDDGNECRNRTIFNLVGAQRELIYITLTNSETF